MTLKSRNPPSHHQNKVQVHELNLKATTLTSLLKLNCLKLSGEGRVGLENNSAQSKIDMVYIWQFVCFSIVAESPDHCYYISAYYL